MGGHRVESIILNELSADPASPEEGQLIRRAIGYKLYTDAVFHRLAGFDGVPVFIFQPGGAVGGNVYTDWNELYAELSEYDGTKDLVFDNTYGVPQVPTGSWDMTGVTWRGLKHKAVTVQVLDGAIISGLRTFDDNIQVQSLATITSPITDMVSGDTIRVMGGSSLRAQGVGAVPFIDVVSGGFSFVYLYLDDYGVLNAGGAAAINLAAGAYLIVWGGLRANIVNNSVSGAAGSYLINLRVNTSATLSESHSSMSGQIISANYCLASALAFTPGTTGLTATDVQAALEQIGGRRTSLIPAGGDQNRGSYRVQEVTASGAHSFTLAMPSDFGSLVSAKLIAEVGTGADGAARDIDLATSYGKVGESVTAHQQSDTVTTYDFTGKVGQWVELDVTSLFSSVEADDFCGINVNHNAIGGSLYYLGVRLEYTVA